jgi:hypothetical protein
VFVRLADSLLKFLVSPKHALDAGAADVQPDDAHPPTLRHPSPAAVDGVRVLVVGVPWR